MHVQTLAVTLTTFLIVNSVGSVSAQVVSPELDACRSTGLIALKEHNPSIKDVSFDVDGMTIAKANTKVEDTVIRPSLSVTPISKKARRIPVEHFSA